MSTPLNVFLREGNVELYLSKLHATWEPAERDTLLRLLAKEESQMGRSREHLENGERRVADGRECLERQRRAIAASPSQEAKSADMLLLETLEQTQMLLEQHLQWLRERLEQHKL